MAINGWNGPFNPASPKGWNSNREFFRRMNRQGKRLAESREIARTRHEKDAYEALAVMRTSSLYH